MLFDGHPSDRWSAVCILLMSLALHGCASGTLPYSVPKNLVSTEDVTILAPGEQVTMQASLRQERKYLCGSGRPLMCHSFARRRECFCPH